MYRGVEKIFVYNDDYLPFGARVAFGIVLTLIDTIVTLAMVDEDVKNNIFYLTFTFLLIYYNLIYRLNIAKNNTKNLKKINNPFLIMLMLKELLVYIFVLLLLFLNFVFGQD